ncbi:hypothetical protein C0993_006908 [Termitomyces sp. T159_Od127]|nr:hypothetical protein C0993_006908 [Termitomyces sp. T159_Od127]
MTIDHHTEVEAVVDSSSQIISMAAEVASDLGLIYDSSIVLNMQSANGTVDRSLGLVKNVPCTIGDYFPLPRPLASILPIVPPALENPSLSYLYLTTSETFESFTTPEKYLTTLPHSPSPAILGLTQSVVPPTSEIHSTYVHANTSKRKGVQVKKKYKPVALKTKPVASSVPEEFRIEQKILGDLLADMPLLDSNLPPFQPTGCFTKERRQQFLKDYDTSFLTHAKLNVLSDLMTKQNKAFAWDDTESGFFGTAK